MDALQLWWGTALVHLPGLEKWNSMRTTVPHFVLASWR
jgi:hypothetical protein